MWLGPPLMKSQITRFAFGAKCGGRGSMGLSARSGAGAAPSSPSSASRPAKPSAPKPIPQRWSIERRDSTGRSRSFLVFMILTGCTGIRSSSSTTGSNRSAPVLQHLAGCSLRKGSAGSR